MNRNRSQKKIGIIFSYLYTFSQFIISFLFTPFLIKSFGINDYGIYQMVSSFATGLAVMNFGISIIMSRNIARARLENNEIEKENILFYGFKITLILFFIVGVIGYISSFLINPIYGDSLTANELSIAIVMFYLLILHVGLIVIQSYFTGIIIGYERYGLTNFMKLLTQVLRVMIILIFVTLDLSIIYIVVADLIVVALVLIVDMYYSFYKLKIRIKKNHSDSALVSLMITFGLASFIQSIIRQVNVTLDKVILGSYMTPSDVTIYSIALLIITSSITMTKVFSSVFLPDATRLVMKNANEEEMTKLITKPGRFQAMIMIGILFGFLLIGKEFLSLWVGDQFTVIYWPVLIMLIPSVLVNVIVTADIILDAKLKKMSRSIILGLTALINFIITIILVPKIGMYGAAIGTSISFILGNIIVLNIYYQKIIKINIVKSYKEIFKGIFLSGLSSYIIVAIVNIFVKFDYLTKMLVSGSLFSILYFGSLYLYGLNQKEKTLISKLLHLKFFD